MHHVGGHVTCRQLHADTWCLCVQGWAAARVSRQQSQRLQASLVLIRDVCADEVLAGSCTAFVAHGQEDRVRNSAHQGLMTGFAGQLCIAQPVFRAIDLPVSIMQQCAAKMGVVSCINRP